MKDLKEKQKGMVIMDPKRRSNVPLSSIDWESKKVRATLARMRELGNQAMRQAKTKRAHKLLERFYSEDAMRERIRLLHDPEVLQMLEQVWEATDTDGSNSIERGEYLVMHRKLVLALDPSVPPKEAFEAARDDWAKDSAGKTSLDRERFFWSWFELADLWTGNFEPQKYVAFLRSTLQTIATVHPLTGKTEWRADRDVIREYFRKRSLGSVNVEDDGQHRPQILSMWHAEIKKDAMDRAASRFRDGFIPTVARAKPPAAKALRVPLRAPPGSGVGAMSSAWSGTVHIAAAPTSNRLALTIGAGTRFACMTLPGSLGGKRAARCDPNSPLPKSIIRCPAPLWVDVGDAATISAPMRAANGTTLRAVHDKALITAEALAREAAEAAEAAAKAAEPAESAQPAEAVEASETRGELLTWELAMESAERGEGASSPNGALPRGRTTGEVGGQRGQCAWTTGHGASADDWAPAAADGSGAPAAAVNAFSAARSDMLSMCLSGLSGSSSSGAVPPSPPARPSTSPPPPLMTSVPAPVPAPLSCSFTEMDLVPACSCSITTDLGLPPRTPHVSRESMVPAPAMTPVGAPAAAWPVDPLASAHTMASSSVPPPPPPPPPPRRGLVPAPSPAPSPFPSPREALISALEPTPVPHDPALEARRRTHGRQRGTASFTAARPAPGPPAVAPRPEDAAGATPVVAVPRPKPRVCEPKRIYIDRKGKSLTALLDEAAVALASLPSPNPLDDIQGLVAGSVTTVRAPMTAPANTTHARGCRARPASASCHAMMPRQHDPLRAPAVLPRPCSAASLRSMGRAAAAPPHACRHNPDSVLCLSRPGSASTTTLKRALSGPALTRAARPMSPQLSGAGGSPARSRSTSPIAALTSPAPPLPPRSAAVLNEQPWRQIQNTFPYGC